MPKGSIQIVCRWHKYLEARVVWQNEGSKSMESLFDLELEGWV